VVRQYRVSGIARARTDSQGPRASGLRNPRLVRALIRSEILLPSDFNALTMCIRNGKFRDKSGKPSNQGGGAGLARGEKGIGSFPVGDRRSPGAGHGRLGVRSPDQIHAQLRRSAGRDTYLRGTCRHVPAVSRPGLGELHPEAGSPPPVVRSSVGYTGAEAEPRRVWATGAQGPYRVLLCEDSQDNAFLIRGYLKDAPYLIEHAWDGRAAAVQIREWVAACNRPATPILALTAHAFMDEEDLCKALGFTAFLSKPLRKATLLAALAEHCAATVCPEQDPDELPPEIQALVPRYLENRIQDLQRLSDTLSARDYGTIEVIGHKMKGAGSSYGFPELTMAGSLIESASKAHDDDGIRLSIGDMRKAIEKK
jgi:CheY-like chemotaxis protein